MQCSWIASSTTAGARVRLGAAAGLMTAAFVLLTFPAAAQQPPVPAAPAAKSAVKPAPPAAPPQAPAAPAPGDGALKARVDSLEEQLVDMQVLVGTLESLAKSGAASSSQVYRGEGAAAAGAPEPGRVEALETQVRQLSIQVQALSDQVRSMGGTPRRSELRMPPPVGQNPNNAVDMPAGGDAIGGLIDDGSQASPAPGSQYAANAPAMPHQGGAVSPPPPAGLAPQPGAVTTAALPPPGDPANPKQMYETAYGYLLQRDYGAAEAAFDDFLKKFPSDSLAGNAQYWLGESHFVRGQYKAAAGAFLKGYQAYVQSPKAPDSLLKLAMSLDRLGQKDAACSSYNELGTKFPNAPQAVKARAQSERQRAGCP